MGTIPGLPQLPLWPFASLPLIALAISYAIRGIGVIKRRWWVPVAFYGFYCLCYVFSQGSLYSGYNTPDLFFFAMKEMTAYLLGPAVCFLLLFDGAAASQPRIPPGHCPHCGYNLTGNESGKCSECSTPVPKATT